MAWPLDEAKLNRVRALMKDQDLSALVVRAPDNVLYLTNYWCMKGYDAVVFPREGDPALIVLEPQLADAERNSWTKNLSVSNGYERKRSWGHVRKLRARLGRRLQRQSRDGAGIHAGLVRRRDQNFHCDRRSPDSEK